MKMIYCPKCNSERIDIVLLNPPAVKRYSLDQLPVRANAVSDLVKRTYKYQAVCEQCGYSVEFIDD